MAKETMVRKASDNKYLHRDFHYSMNFGLEYVREQYGEEAVREYLCQFAAAFYAPLKEALKIRGLSALKDYFENIYRLEEALEDIELELSEDTLLLRIKRCPGVTYIRRISDAVSPLYYETTRTVNETLCEGTPFAFKLVSYDRETGACEQRFYRKEAIK